MQFFNSYRAALRSFRQREDEEEDELAKLENLSSARVRDTPKSKLISSSMHKYEMLTYI